MRKAGRLTVFMLTLALILSLSGCGEFLKSVNSLEIDSGGYVKAFSISEFDLKYTSLEDYASFNNVLAWSGTLTSAIENGYFDRSTAVISSDGTLKTTVGELESEFGGKTASRRGSSLKVLIVEEPLMIKVPGKVRYTIGDVTMEGRYAITGAGSLTTLLDEPCYIIYK